LLPRNPALCVFLCQKFEKYGGGKEGGEVRILESKELRNALREMEKLDENKRNDGEYVII